MDLEDIQVIKPYFDFVTSNTCDFTVGGLFMWRDYYSMEYTEIENVLISRLYDLSGKVYYNLPLCADVEQGIKLSVEQGAEAFCTIPEEYLPSFLKLYPDARVTEQRIYFDYLYYADELISLTGKKFSPQRNLISQFKRNTPSWQFFDIRELSMDAVERFFLEQYSVDGHDSLSAVTENRMVLEVIKNPDKYSMVGGALTDNGKIIGFSLGEIANDTLFTHIEKADRGYKGVYQMLTNEFVRAFAQGLSYVNREEDMGDQGLRRAKEAYNPCKLLKKYTVEVF